MEARAILIVGRSGDPSVQLLLEQWARHGPALLTPRDLTSAGIVHRPDHPTDDRVTLHGEPLLGTKIRAVVPLLARVLPTDLSHVRSLDRGYVAGETTAFLDSWLATLSCRVINRPRGGPTGGPRWSHFRWVRSALEQGFAVAPARLEVTWKTTDDKPPAPQAGASVIIAGSAAHGDDVDPALRERAQRLATLAEVDLLEVRFDGRGRDARFVHANAQPALTPAVAASLLAVIEGDAAANTGGLS